MPRCDLCKNRIDDGHRCERCNLNLFQLTEILEVYIEYDSPPEWLLAGVRELAWIFKEYPYTSAYFNTAAEVTELFTIDKASKLTEDDIKEVNFTSLPMNKVLSVLERALIIRREDGEFYPGKLVEKLQHVRWEGYKMDTPQIENKLLELHGILTVTLTKALVEGGTYIPHRALAVLSIISLHILSCEDGSIGKYVPGYTCELAFASERLGSRQKRRIVRMMIGFSDGKTKLISDVTDDRQMELKDCMVDYAVRIRERYRERERDRERGSDTW